jgi:hypothetical protein
MNSASISSGVRLLPSARSYLLKPSGEVHTAVVT